MIDLKLNPSRKELKWFAALQVVFFAVVAGVVYRETGTYGITYHEPGSAGIAAAIVGTSFVVGVIGFLKPQLMRWIYVPWMIAVFPIGWVVSHLVIAVMFYGVITPIGLVMRACGRDPMQRKFDAEAQTYWLPRPQDSGTQRYFRQF